MTLFAPRTDVDQVELGAELAPRFDADGLRPVIVVEVDSQLILMDGYMNAQALERTILTRETHSGRAAGRRSGARASIAASPSGSSGC